MLDPAITVYLFQCRGEDLFAVSHDITGANIPRSPCTQGWVFCEQFQLGTRTRVPAPIMPEPIMRGIADKGYYVWRGWSGSSDRPNAGTQGLTPLERAFQLAKSGGCLSIVDIKKQMQAEGFSIGQITGKSLYKQLKALLLAAQG